MIPYLSKLIKAFTLFSLLFSECFHMYVRKPTAAKSPFQCAVSQILVIAKKFKSECVPFPVPCVMLWAAVTFQVMGATSLETVKEKKVTITQRLNWKYLLQYQTKECILNRFHPLILKVLDSTEYVHYILFTGTFSPWNILQQGLS